MPDEEDKESVTAFLLVFDDTVSIAAGHSAVITYHTTVKDYPDDTDFNANRAFENAVNDFYLFYAGYGLVQTSNPVSVTLLEEKGNFYLAEGKGIRGWIQKEYVTPDQEEPSEKTSEGSD